MTMYELMGRWMELEEMAGNESIDQDVLKDTFEALEGEIEYKADCYAKIITSLTAQSDAITKEIRRLTSRRQACDNNIARMKAVLMEAMEATNKQKFRTDLYSYSIRKTASHVVVHNLQEIPSEYLKVAAPEPIKAKIKEALDKGENVPGAHLEPGITLSIR